MARAEDLRLIERFLEAFVVERRAARNSVLAYRRDLVDFARTIDRPLATVTAADVRSYLAALDRRGLKAATVARRLSALRRFFLFLLEEGLRADDPMADIDSPKLARRLPRVLDENAVERLLAHDPPWPLPKIMRLKKKGGLDEELFRGSTINTPSMMCVEDWLDALAWAESLGGLPALIARADRNAAVLDAWVRKTPWIAHLVADPAIRSNTSVCLKIVDPAVAALPEPDQRAFVKRLCGLLEEEGVAYDIAGYRNAPPGLRIWCGATVEAEDVAALGPWLDWAFHETKAALVS